MGGASKDPLLGLEPSKHAWPSALPDGIFGPFSLMLLAAALCTLNNSFVHGLQMNLGALIQGRYLVQWIFGLAALSLRCQVKGVPFHPFGPPGARRWLVLRGVVYYGFIWLWWVTLTLVPMGDAVAVVKFEAFVSGLASAALFGERLTPRWWGCCVASLVGVILLVRPPLLFGGDDHASMLGRFLNVLTPIVSGFLPCFIKLAPTAHFLEVQHSCDFICALILSPPMLLLSGGGAALLVLSMWGAITVVALVGISALCAFTLAYQSGQIGRVSIVGYAEVPLAYATQVLVFGAGVEPLALGGACLIVVSAIFASTEIKRGRGSSTIPSPPASPNLEPPCIPVPPGVAVEEL